MIAPEWETMLEDMDAARQFVAEWTATEEDEHENEDSQSIVVAGQSVPYIIRDRGDMDVSMLPAQPARQADEDAERLTNLLDCIAKSVTSRSDAVWLRELLIDWLHTNLEWSQIDEVDVLYDALQAVEL